jgi:hypothetical protein
MHFTFSNFVPKIVGYLKKKVLGLYLNYEGKSLNNRDFILKYMEKYAQQKILFRDTRWLLSSIVVVIEQYEPAQ